MSASVHPGEGTDVPPDDSDIDIHTTAGKLQDLDRRLDEAVHAGSAKAVEKQHAKGRQTARERIERRERGPRLARCEEAPNGVEAAHFFRKRRRGGELCGSGPALGFGALAGPLVAFLVAAVVRGDLRAPVGMVLLGAPVAGVALATGHVWALAPLALAGAAATFVEAEATGHIQRAVPDDARAGVLGVTDSAMVAAAMVGAFGAPLHEAETLLAWAALRPEHEAEGRRLAEAHAAPGLRVPHG